MATPDDLVPTDFQFPNGFSLGMLRDMVHRL